MAVICDWSSQIQPVALGSRLIGFWITSTDLKYTLVRIINFGTLSMFINKHLELPILIHNIKYFLLKYISYQYDIFYQYTFAIINIINFYEFNINASVSNQWYVTTNHNDLFRAYCLCKQKYRWFTENNLWKTILAIIGKMMRLLRLITYY